MNKRLIIIAKYLASNGFYDAADNIIKLSSKDKELVISNIVANFDYDGFLELKVHIKYGDVKSDCEIYLKSTKLSADQWGEIAKKVNDCIKGNSGEETSFSPDDVKKSISKEDQKLMYADIKRKREEWERWYDAGGYHALGQRQRRS